MINFKILIKLCLLGIFPDLMCRFDFNCKFNAFICHNQTFRRKFSIKVEKNVIANKIISKDTFCFYNVTKLKFNNKFLYLCGRFRTV